MVLRPSYKSDIPSKYQRSSIESHVIEISSPPAMKRATSLSDTTDIPQNEVIHPQQTTQKPTIVTNTESTNKEETSDNKNAEDTGALNPNHRVKYKDVVKILTENYNFDENKNSTALDILALYLKGQKIIYMESKTYCEKRLNTLMLPAILLAAICSILNFILKDYSFGITIISSLNACNSFILSIINYLKLAEKSQNHLMAAQRFSSLESRLELQSGHSLFFHDAVKIEKSLEEMEKEIKEIQSSNQFLIPEAIRYRYPKIFSSNIFSLVKEIKNEEVLCINELKAAVQKLREYTTKREELIEQKKILINTIDQYNDTSHQLKLDKDTIDLNIRDLEDPNEESIVVYNESIEPPILQLPQPDLSSEELYQQIGAWKEKYDSYVSKYKESDTYKKEIIDAGKQKQRINKMEYRRELIKNGTLVRTNITHIDLCLEEAKIKLKEVEKGIADTIDDIDRYDLKKDKAFEKIVKHRQRYIELSDDMNREINQHIIKKKRCCNCNPCEFFNT